MKAHGLIFVLAIALFGTTLAAACNDNGDTSQSPTTQDARDALRNAWSELSTNGERLIDEIQTRGDSDAKRQLLDRCRDTLERLRREDASNVDRVDRLCNRIRDADVDDRSVWTQIRDEFSEMDREFAR